MGSKDFFDHENEISFGYEIPEGNLKGQLTPEYASMLIDTVRSISIFAGNFTKRNRKTIPEDHVNDIVQIALYPEAEDVPKSYEDRVIWIKDNDRATLAITRLNLIACKHQKNAVKGIVGRLFRVIGGG